MIKAIIHDTATRRTFLPSVHFVYEGENVPFSSPNVLVVDVDTHGDVKHVTPLDDSIEVSYFYVQKDDDQPTLHIQGVFPAIIFEEESSSPTQRGMPQSSSDLLEEFLVRNEFIRAKIREARDDGFFIPLPAPNINLGEDEGVAQKESFPLSVPPIPSTEDTFLQQQHPWAMEEVFKFTSVSPAAFTPSLAPLTTSPTFTSPATMTPLSSSNTALLPTSPRRVGLSITPPTDNSNMEGISSPDRRKGAAAPTIISPYKGLLPRHPSPTPIPSVVKSKLHRGALFLEDANDLSSRTPSPSNPSTPSSVATTSPLPSPVSSPPQVELKNQVDRILHTALQLKTSLELMGGVNGFDTGMEDLAFEPIARRPSSIRRNDGNIVLPP